MADEPQRAYRGRVPSAPMDAEHLVHLLGQIEGAGIIVWIDGGWGVDALLEEQTREHDDLDLVLELAACERLEATLEAEGYERVVGAPPKSFVLVDGIGRQVDAHPVEFDANGDGLYVMDDGVIWPYPAEGFSGRGRVAGRPVRCLSPATQVIVHAGYELTEKDFRELRLLNERFGVGVDPNARA
jgi:lincosamide nucleotidyltransferase A/C/D/E